MRHLHFRATRRVTLKVDVTLHHTFHYNGTEQKRILVHFENESEDRDSRKLFHFNFLERRNKIYKASLYLFRRLLIFVFVFCSCVCLCVCVWQLINEFCVGHLCFYLLFPVVFVFDFVFCAGHFVFLCCGGRWSLLSCR